MFSVTINRDVVMTKTTKTTKTNRVSSELDELLLKNGFACCGTVAYDQKERGQSRVSYSRGSLRFLTEARDRPFWTVQRLTGGHVRWFVDFPLDVDLEAIMAFLDACSC